MNDYITRNRLGDWIFRRNPVGDYVTRTYLGDSAGVLVSALPIVAVVAVGWFLVPLLLARR